MAPTQKQYDYFLRDYAKLKARHYQKMMDKLQKWHPEVFEDYFKNAQREAKKKESHGSGDLPEKGSEVQESN